MKSLVFIALLSATVFATTTSVAWAQTTYSVRFDSEWSASTHPTSFPPNPHLSPLIGGTHNEAYSMWAPGQLARNGMESMAETGASALLRAEVESRIGFGSAFSVIHDVGIDTSPGAVETTFQIAASHPLVSLVSMIAPSPDWFVGVHDLSLVENGAWINSLTVELFPYDSGTDSGTGYTSANADTNPAETISAITGSPFLAGNQLIRIGTFTFTCLSGCGGVPTETEDPRVVPQSFFVGAPFPNPAVNFVTIPVTPGDVTSIRVEMTNVLGRSISFEAAVRPGRSEQLIQVPVEALASGLWFIRVSGPDQAATSSVVLAR